MNIALERRPVIQSYSKGTAHEVSGTALLFEKLHHPSELCQKCVSIQDISTWALCFSRFRNPSGAGFVTKIFFPPKTRHLALVTIKLCYTGTV